MLGSMYANGNGVPKDHAKAVHWFTKAAKQGEEKAQYNLSVGYVKGEGVPGNYVRGYAWVSIAAAQGYAEGKRNKGIIAKHMTPNQIAEA